MCSECSHVWSGCEVCAVSVYMYGLGVRSFQCYNNMYMYMCIQSLDSQTTLANKKINGQTQPAWLEEMAVQRISLLEQLTKLSLKTSQSRHAVQEGITLFLHFFAGRVVCKECLSICNSSSISKLII